LDWVKILIQLVFAFIIMNVSLVIVAFLVYFERKVGAYMQNRYGPNQAGPVGTLQSFADLIKMLRKEETIPGGADRWVFWFAPVVSAFASLGTLSVLPFGPGTSQGGYMNIFGWKIPWFISDVSVGALVVLALSSLGVYGIIMAGWSANSKYSLLGGLRSASQVISYEISLGLSLIGVFILASSLSLLTITNAQHPSYHVLGLQPGFWFIFLQPVAFFVFLTSAIAETNRNPFDLPEAESELVGGYHTEFSGIRFGLMFLSEYIGMLTVSITSSVFFLGGYGSPLAAFFDPKLVNGQLVYPNDIFFLSGLLGSGVHWLVLKIAAFIFVYYWLRWTLPRFRYDQLMGLTWKIFLPTILVNIMVLSVLKLILFPPLQPGQDPATAYSQLNWYILAAVEVVIAVAVIMFVSRFAASNWFGKAESPVLVEEPRQVILVRTVTSSRGAIKGEARPVEPGSTAP
jgi:NADH-quinone oxidoreductase subunit H